MKKGPDDKRNADRYTAKATKAVILEAAAEAYHSGVPWDEALALATKAIEKANRLIYPMAKPKPKAKPKAKAKAKGHAR